MAADAVALVAASPAGVPVLVAAALLARFVVGLHPYSGEGGG